MFRILFVLGGGGHTSEIVKVAKAMEGNYEPGYLMAEDDVVSRAKIPKEGKVFLASRAGNYNDNKAVVVAKVLKLTAQSWRILHEFNPDVIISAGPGICVPVSVLGKMLGKKIVFIEDWARVKTKSGAGKIMYHIADVFYVQHKELTELYPEAVYGGML